MPVAPGVRAAPAAAAAPLARAGVPSWKVAALVFAVCLPALLIAYSGRPLLYDTDSYYHLAIGRLVAAGGFPDDLPALRASALGPGFGDKEPLFHMLLAAFAGVVSPLTAGRMALALLDALVLALLAGLGHRAVGWWGLLAPAWVAIGSLEVAWRLVRLRPELLSLALLLLALAAAGSGRYRLLGVAASAYALSYTAWHAFVGVFWALFLFRGWARRRWDWPLLAYPLLGALVGLVVNPAFPDNLLIWKMVAWDFFRNKGVLDVGSEIRPNLTQVALLANLGWWAVAAVVWRARAPRHDAPRRTAEPASQMDLGRGATAPAGPGADVRAAAGRTEGLADAFGVAAAAFGLLYLLMSRFSLYFFPFAALWLLFEVARRDETLGPRLRLPFRGSLPTAVALAAAAVVCLPGTVQETRRFAHRTSAGPQQARLADYVAFGRAVPPGAHVAAPWQATPIYLLWAPQARYLNVLDPMLMAVPFPEAYAAQRAVFDGDEPDVPLAATVTLDSAFVAWSLPGAPPRLLERLTGDPRARRLHLGFQALFAVAPAPPGAFHLDWRVAPAGTSAAAAAAGPAPSSWPPYPRHPSPEGRAIEGYVDARRVTARGCVTLVASSAGRGGEVELAPSGPTRLWVGGKPVVTVGGQPGAVLGQGVRFALPAAAGPLAVVTCPDARGRTGFYLLQRG